MHNEATVILMHKSLSIATGVICFLPVFTVKD